MSIALYPNPASDQLNISINAQTASNATLKIINQQGQAMAEKQVALQAGRNTIAIQVSDMPAGLYYLSLGNDKDVYLIFAGKASTRYAAIGPYTIVTKKT